MVTLLNGRSNGEDSVGGNLCELKMGLRQFSMVAQFGNLGQMKTGLEDEVKLNEFELTLD